MQERTPQQGKSRTILGIVAAVVIVVVLLLALALTGVARGLFAKDVDRVVRNDVDASGLVATLVSYPDSFRGSTLAQGQVDLQVQIDQAALTGGDPAARPATVVVRNYSCPGADSAAADAVLTIQGADAAHVAARPAEAGGGVALTGAFEITAVAPVRPAVQVPAGTDPVAQCRIDLVAR
ncbi:hypothetical protein ACR9E3_21895 [Actinomycetospora sp. C-140]